MEEITISIGGREYDVLVAQTEEEKVIGLSKTKHLPKDEGMLFVYDEPDDLIFTMEDTSIDLDIIFIDESLTVVSVHSVKAGEEAPIEEVDVQYVLEVCYGSGIQEGDELEQLDDEDEEDIQKMLVLDSSGNVQAEISSGSRIFSRKKTKQMLVNAIKAWRTDDDNDYRRVGRIVLKELDAQDGREKEYVQLEQ